MSMKPDLPDNKNLFRCSSLVLADFIDKDSGKHLYLNLDLFFGEFKSFEEAIEISSSAKVKVEHNHLVVETRDKANSYTCTYRIEDEDIVFKILKDSSRKQVLNKTNDLKYAYFYTSDKDFCESDISLKHFISHFKHNELLYNVVAGVKNIVKN